MATKAKPCKLFIKGQCNETSRWCQYSHDTQVCMAASPAAKAKGKAQPKKRGKNFVCRAMAPALPFLAAAAMAYAPTTAESLKWSAGDSHDGTSLTVGAPWESVTSWTTLESAHCRSGIVQYWNPDPNESVCMMGPKQMACMAPKSAPLAAAGRLSDRFRRWLMDTGCGNDIANTHQLTPSMKATVYDAGDQAICFDTANGETNANDMCTVSVPALKVETTIEAYCLEQSPDVLSIGRRCVLLGFGFYWPPWSRTPMLIPPGCSMPKFNTAKAKDQWIWLEEDGFVPYLVDKRNLMPSNAAAFPAPMARQVPRPVPPRVSAERPWDSQYGTDQLVQPIPEEDAAPALAAEAKAVEPECKPCGKQVDWRAEALSIEHLTTHRPFNIYCEICRASKPSRKAKPDRAKQRKKAAEKSAKYIHRKPDEPSWRLGTTPLATTTFSVAKSGKVPMKSFRRNTSNSPGPKRPSSCLTWELTGRKSILRL